MLCRKIKKLSYYTKLKQKLCFFIIFLTLEKSTHIHTLIYSHTYMYIHLNHVFIESLKTLYQMIPGVWVLTIYMDISFTQKCTYMDKLGKYYELLIVTLLNCMICGIRLNLFIFQDEVLLKTCNNFDDEKLNVKRILVQLENSIKSESYY